MRDVKNPIVGLYLLFAAVGIIVFIGVLPIFILFGTVVYSLFSAL